MIEKIYFTIRKRSRRVSRRCCARLTCPRSPFYQPLLPPSGTKNCVCTDYMPVEYLSRFDGNPYVCDVCTHSPLLSDQNERLGICIEQLVSYFGRGCNFFLVKYDGRQARSFFGAISWILARCFSRKTGRRARCNLRLQTAPGRAKCERLGETTTAIIVDGNRNRHRRPQGPNFATRPRNSEHRRTAEPVYSPKKHHLP